MVEIVINNSFANKKYPGHANHNVGSFIRDYTTDPEAVESLIIDDARYDDYLAKLQALQSPEDLHAQNLVNKKLKYDGTAFSLDDLSLTRKDTLAGAKDCDLAYQNGASIRQMVVSFDTDYLKQHNLLIDPDKPIKLRVDLAGNVKQTELRLAAQAAFVQLSQDLKLNDPACIAAIQVDTKQVHIHASLFDKDQAAVDDRGMINEKQRTRFKSEFLQTLQQLPEYPDEILNIQQIAEVTQNNARFKLAMLGKQLQRGAWEQDRMAVSQYVNGLASFAQVNLNEKQRDEVEAQVLNDLREVGKPAQQKHRLTTGEKRDRQHVTALRRSIKLRKELQRFNQLALTGKVVPQAQIVKETLQFELQRQNLIIEKYRGFNRQKTDFMYQKNQLNLRRQQAKLRGHRRDLFRDLGVKPINQTVITNLLSNAEVMQNLQGNHFNVVQSSEYQELQTAKHDGYFPLSETSVNLATKHLDDPAKAMTKYALQVNQQIEPDHFNASQRQLYLQYLDELDEYEQDAMLLGGLSPKLTRVDNQQSLQMPQQTTSIYNRKKLIDDPDLIASDAADIVKQGPLKPEVELAMRKQFAKRSKLLLKTHRYFVATKQQEPEWLTFARDDLLRQSSLLNHHDKTAQTFNREPKSYTNGFDLSQNQRQRLVDKHLKTVSVLGR